MHHGRVQLGVHLDGGRLAAPGGFVDPVRDVEQQQVRCPHRGLVPGEAFLDPGLFGEQAPERCGFARGELDQLVDRLPHRAQRDSRAAGENQQDGVEAVRRPVEAQRRVEARGELVGDEHVPWLPEPRRPAAFQVRSIVSWSRWTWNSRPSGLPTSVSTGWSPSITAPSGRNQSAASIPLTIRQWPDSRYPPSTATARPGWPPFANTGSAPPDHTVAAPAWPSIAAVKPKFAFQTTQAAEVSIRPNCS